MEKNGVFLFALASILVLAPAMSLLAYLAFRYQRCLIPDRYVWLRVMTTSEWLELFDLQSKMFDYTGTCGTAFSSSDIKQLQREGLIESRTWCRSCEYRLTLRGLKEKIRRDRATRVRQSLPRTV